jgi:hypothetical protein
MSNDPRRLTTQDEREQLYAARYRGGICSACGRTLDEGEPVYWEQVNVGTVGGYTNRPQAPVGSECISPAFLEETEDRESERCAGCARPVYYREPRRGRHLAICSKRCGMRVSNAKRQARKQDG